MLLLAAAFFAASTSPDLARDMPLLNPTPDARLCPETPMSLARKMGKRPPRAFPLTQLPPAQTFMAVDRRIDGCEAPLTMVKYRQGQRR
jgi:hypothetical protein